MSSRVHSRFEVTTDKGAPSGSDVAAKYSNKLNEMLEDDDLVWQPYTVDRAPGSAINQMASPMVNSMNDVVELAGKCSAAGIFVYSYGPTTTNSEPTKFRVWVRPPILTDDTSPLDSEQCDEVTLNIFKKKYGEVYRDVTLQALCKLSYAMSSESSEAELGPLRDQVTALAKKDDAHIVEMINQLTAGDGAGAGVEVKRLYGPIQTIVFNTLNATTINKITDGGFFRISQYDVIGYIYPIFTKFTEPVAESVADSMAEPARHEPETLDNLNDVVQKAIADFTTNISSEAAFAAFLTKLSTVITDEHVSEKAEVDKKVADLEKGRAEVLKAKELEASTPVAIKPKLESMTKNISEVKEFITKTPDAIFLVTGGSFNPPHNGHIKMFETAYNQLMTIEANNGKRVYGVMVPAPNAHIEDKLCKETVVPKNGSNCDEDERKQTMDNIESKRIILANRVNLCKLSCDSFEWTSKDKFGAENMIVVSEHDGDPGKTIVSNSTANTYYLCGSDYYAAHGTSNYKFICVLRKGVTYSSRRGTAAGQIAFTDPPIKNITKTSFTVKTGDIIIPGSEDDDSEASSSRLRAILDTIRNAKDSDIYDSEEPVKRKLLTQEVYCELLKMKYIVGDKGNNIATTLRCVSSGNDTDGILNSVAGVTHNGARSLCNIGNMCYMNAALQLIYSMPDFTTAIKNSIPDNPLTPYLSAMDNGVDCANAEKLANVLYDFAKRKGFARERRFGDQEDSGELITTIFTDSAFDKYKDSMKFTSSQATVYTGDQSIEDCKSLNTDVLKKIPESGRGQLLVLPKQRDENAQDRTLELPVALNNGITPLVTFKGVFDAYTGNVNIDERFDDSTELSNLTNTNGIIFNLPGAMMQVDARGNIIKPKRLKDGCKGLVTVVKSNSVDKPFTLKYIKSKTYIFPGEIQKYFIVTLKRTIPDGNDEHGNVKTKKLTHKVALENARINIGKLAFTIKGCICHHGSNPNNGHYTYVEFVSGVPTMVYDDAHICPYNSYVDATRRTVDDDGYILLFEKETS
jgi:hypothetical protein